MPRVRYKPWTVYEEMFGFKMVKKISRTLLYAMVFSNCCAMMMYSAYGASRHLAHSKEGNREFERQMAERLEMINTGPKKKDELENARMSKRRNGTFPGTF